MNPKVLLQLENYFKESKDSPTSCLADRERYRWNVQGRRINAAQNRDCQRQKEVGMEENLTQALIETGSCGTFESRCWTQLLSVTLEEIRMANN